jgi:hypothetical protein
MATKPMRVKVPFSLFNSHEFFDLSSADNSPDQLHEFELRPGKALVLPEARPVHRIHIKKDEKGELYLELEQG